MGQALEGLLARTDRDRLLLHRNAQRLLQPLAVVNPYAGQLRFRDDQTRSRRDHVKYLTLIRAIALLHQAQRDVKTLQHKGQTLRYIEVVPSDIALANELAQEVLGRTVDELLPQTRRLLMLLHAWVREGCERENVAPCDFHFTRGQAREAAGWGDTQLWTHLSRLVEMAFLAVHRGRSGRTLEYELLYQMGEDVGQASPLGLIDSAMLQCAATTTNIRGQGPDDSGEIRSTFGGDSGLIRGVLIAREATDDRHPRGSEPGIRETAHRGGVRRRSVVSEWGHAVRQKPGTKPYLQPIGDLRDPGCLWNHMQRFMEHLEVRNYSPRTVLTWRAYLRYFIAWCDERGLARPEQIDRPILERYQRHLFYYRKGNGAPLTVRSQQTRIVPLRRWFQWLVRQRHLLYNPAIDLEMPRGERRIPRAILTAKEAEAVLAIPEIGSVRGLRDRAILETFYSTGIRRLELINLSIHDLDYERGTLLIRQGKGKKDRMIPIGERALLWIAAYRDRARPDLTTGRDDTTLFLSINGGPIHTNRMSRLVKDYVDAANLGKKGACHLFRHTMATLMLENGADIRFIQAMLGHAELSTTEIYTQVGIRMLKMVHATTHPGKLPEVARKKLEAEQEPTAEDLLAKLDLEAAEEGEV